MFKKHISNRKLVPFVLKRLVESMKKRGFLPTQPITVNSKMEVISGQHRLAAAKEVECGVYYIVDMTVTATDMLDYEHASSSWSVLNFIDAQASMGSEGIGRLQDLMRELKISHGMVAAIGYSETGRSKFAQVQKIRTGTLEFTEEDADWVRLIIKRRNDFLIPVNEKWLSMSVKFLQSLAWVSRLKDYDHERMIEKYQRQQYKLIRCSTRDQYLEILNSIYNYQTMKNFLELRGSKHK